MISTNIVQTGLMTGAENVSLSAGNAEDISTCSTDFSSFMSNSGSTDTSAATTGDTKMVINGNVQTMPSNSEKINILFTAKNQNISNEIVEEDMIANMDTLMTVDAAAMQLIQHVMEIIQSDTGCSEEEFINAMNNIGVKPTDLLSPDTVKSIVLELNGLSEPQELLTNQEVYTQFVDIMEQIKPLIDDFTAVYEFTPEQNPDISETINQFITQKEDVSDIPQEITFTDGQMQDIKPEEKIQSDKPVETQVTVETQQDTVPEDNEGNMDKSIQNDMQNNTLNNVQNDMQGSIQNDMQDNIQNDIQNNIQSSIQNSIRENTDDEYTGNIPDEVNAEVIEKTEYMPEQNAEYVPEKIVEEVVEEAAGKTENNNDILKDAVNNQNQSEYVITDESADDAADVVVSYKAQNETEMNQDNNSNSGENQQNMEAKQNTAGKTAEVHIENRKNVNNTDFTTISNNLFEHIKESVSNVQTAETSQTSFATRIFNQVMEGIKVISGGDMSSMEMQLQPENLGKLNIQVVSKNGIITAQIVTQSEAVKQAIESQMFLLKENMNNQDITIEDVEVTVSSHAFEQGMDNGNHENSNQQQKRRKFVSEDDMQSLNAAELKAIKEEVLEEAMKEQNGSTVSYTA